MADRYTKVVLTVIAVALLWLCVQATMPMGTFDVNIAAIEGKTLSTRSRFPILPVTVQGDVEAHITNWSDAALWLE